MSAVVLDSFCHFHIFFFIKTWKLMININLNISNIKKSYNLGKINKLCWTYNKRATQLLTYKCTSIETFANAWHVIILSINMR